MHGLFSDKGIQVDDIGSFKSKLKTWLFKDAYKKHLWQLLLWQLPLVVLSCSLRLLLLTAFVCYVHVLAKWCVFTCVSFPFITYIIYNPIYASIFTSTVCVFLCFNLCSAFEYCYRYQRFTNKSLLLLLLYKCQICEKEYTHNKNLQEHIQYEHTMERQKWNECDQEVCNLSSLQRHNKAKHLKQKVMCKNMWGRGTFCSRYSLNHYYNTAQARLICHLRRNLETSRMN